MPEELGYVPSEAQDEMKKMDESKEDVKKIENIDEYEREKIERTIADLKQTTAIIDNYLKMMDFADTHHIKIDKRTLMDKIRYQDGPAGPDNDMIKLQGLFAKGQAEIAHSIPREHVEELKKLGLVK